LLPELAYYTHLTNLQRAAGTCCRFWIDMLDISLFAIMLLVIRTFGDYSGLEFKQLFKSQCAKLLLWRLIYRQSVLS